MELKDFVKAALTQIVEAVVEAQEDVKKHQAIIVPTSSGEQTDSQIVKFNMAVTVVDAKEGNAGGKIQVMGAGIGAGGKLSNAETHVSHVEFGVEVRLPGQKDSRPVAQMPKPPRVGIV